MRSLNSSVDRQECRARHAVLQAGPRGPAKGVRPGREPLVERPDPPSKGQDLRPGELEQRSRHARVGLLDSVSRGCNARFLAVPTVLRSGTASSGAAMSPGGDRMGTLRVRVAGLAATALLLTGIVGAGSAAAATPLPAHVFAPY